MKEGGNEAGLSQEGLADLAHLHRRTIRQWERGNFGEAKLLNVKAAADALGCKIDDLL